MKMRELEKALDAAIDGFVDASRKGDWEAWRKNREEAERLWIIIRDRLEAEAKLDGETP